jgi:hypothetical protein
VAAGGRVLTTSQASWARSFWASGLSVNYEQAENKRPMKG